MVKKMGLFQNLFKRSEKPESKKEISKEKSKVNSKDISKEFLEIAGLISYQDQEIMDELRKFMADPHTYFTEHRDMFEEWGMCNYSEERYFARDTLVGFLEKGNYICVRDWKDEKEDFIYYVKNLVGFQKSGLRLEDDWLDENDGIGIWSGILDSKWKEKGYCMADIDIEADSYALFVCSTDTLNSLQSLAESIGYHIDLAKEM